MIIFLLFVQYLRLIVDITHMDIHVNTQDNTGMLDKTVIEFGGKETSLPRTAWVPVMSEQ